MPNHKKIFHVVIFTGGNAPPPKSTKAFWKSPLCFSAPRPPDFVIAADFGLETLKKYRDYFSAKKIDFFPNLILGDFDSVSEKKILSDYPKKIIKKFSAKKNFTDTELALMAAKKRFGKNAFITLVGGEGGRADHFLGIYDLFGTKLSPDAWICGKQVLYFAKRKKFFAKDLKKKDAISVSRANGKIRGGKIATRGLEWESGLFRKRGMPSISNAISKKHFEKKLPIEFCFFRGEFVLILPLFAKVSIF